MWSLNYYTLNFNLVTWPFSYEMQIGFGVWSWTLLWQCLSKRKKAKDNHKLKVHAESLSLKSILNVLSSYWRSSQFISIIAIERLGIRRTCLISTFVVRSLTTRYAPQFSSAALFIYSTFRQLKYAACHGNTMLVFYTQWRNTNRTRMRKEIQGCFSTMNSTTENTQKTEWKKRRIGPRPAGVVGERAMLGEGRIREEGRGVRLCPCLTHESVAVAKRDAAFQVSQRVLFKRVLEIFFIRSPVMSRSLQRLKSSLLANRLSRWHQ